MNIDHICFAVPNLEKGIQFWETVFQYEQMTREVINTRQQVKVVFMKNKENLIIKLIEPLEENSSLKRFVKSGGGFHHLCFKCSDINKQVSVLKKQGLVTAVPPQPGEAFDNELIAFLLTRHGFKIELIDTDKKAGRLS